MVVLVDLDDADDASHVPHALVHRYQDDGACDNSIDSRPNPNINGFSAALSCYP